MGRKSLALIDPLVLGSNPGHGKMGESLRVTVLIELFSVKKYRNYNVMASWSPENNLHPADLGLC